MSLSEQTVKMAYSVILGRDPSDEETAHMIGQHANLGELRHAFLSSAEFEQKYTRFREQLYADRPETLIHLHIPKTAGTTLAEALSKTETLQPNMIVHDHALDELRALPRQKRRALRYIRGHLSMGAGEALGFPYRHMCLIRRPGPRIFSFYQFIRRTRTHPSFQDLDSADMSFGDYLEYSVEHVPHRLELDNGQIRRLSGVFDHNSLGRETQLLKTALYTVLDPKMLFGFVEDIGTFIEKLVAEGYLANAELENLNVSPNSNQYQSSLDALTPAQRTIFDSYTAWDSYFYEVCQQIFSK